MRKIGKILFLLFALSLLVSGGTLAYFKSWRTKRIAQLDSGSQIADTIRGNVEYALKGQSGPPVLVFHGAPGGYDQALLLGRNLSENGFQVLAPSRPGYLRTPLTTGLTPEEQADAMCALVDSVGYDKVAVLGFSVGCPAAVQFVIRHPDRVWGLVLVSTVLKSYFPMSNAPHSIMGELLYHNGYSDIESWLLFEESVRFPERSLRRMLSQETNIPGKEKEKTAFLVAKNAAQLRWYQDLLATTVPMSVRHLGTINDTAQLHGLPPVPYNSVQVPTLIIHGANDADTPAADVKFAMAKLGGSTYMEVQDSGPIVWLGPNGEAVDQKILQFLQLIAPNRQPSTP